MKWTDNHCDVLYQLWKREKEPQSLFSEKQSPINLFRISRSPLDVSYEMLVYSNVRLQNFAIFIPDDISQTGKLEAVIKQVDLFYEYVEPYVPLFQNLEEGEEDKLCSVLSLEGGESIGKDLSVLRLLHRLGVRQVGLTWNYSNAIADGCKEERNGGLTNFGKQCVEEMVRLRMIVDVSHLSERGFWDVVSIPNVKVMASHSNCQKYCQHPRNLTDDQIRQIISLNGLIGITYVPQFVMTPYEEARIEHLLFHIRHMYDLGGENHIAFGSDFDGMENKLPGLNHAGDLPRFYEVLTRTFSHTLVEKWTYRNSFHFYKNAIR